MCITTVVCNCFSKACLEDARFDMFQCSWVDLDLEQVLETASLTSVHFLQNLCVWNWFVIQLQKRLSNFVVWFRKRIASCLSQFKPVK